MAITGLTDTQSRADFFRRSIRINLRYWQAWLKDKITNVAALDQE